MLKRLSTSLLLPGELSETITKFDQAVKELGITHAFLLTILALLGKDVTRIRQAITALRFNKKIKSVAEAAAQREDSFVGFKDYIESSRRRRDEAIKEAHAAIWAILEAVGTQLYRLGYVEQTAKLEALFSELDKPENQAYLLTLRADDYYAELKESQEDFLTLSGEKRTEDELQQYPSLDTSKSTAVPHVNAFLSIVGVMQEVSEGDEKEQFNSLIDKLNIIIADIMTVARARKTRKENQNSSDDNSNGPSGILGLLSQDNAPGNNT